MDKSNPLKPNESKIVGISETEMQRRAPEFSGCTRNADAVCVTLYAQRARQLKLNGGTEEEEETDEERSRNV